MPTGETFDTFDFNAVPMVSKAQVMALAAGDGWLDQGAVSCSSPARRRQVALGQRFGRRSSERPARPVHPHDRPRPAAASSTPGPGARGRHRQADKYQLLILDDIAYVTKDQAETSVLFELIAARYERRSLLITANQPFGEWGKIFTDKTMTLAAIDRLVHHATILEMNVESYRRKAALKRKRGKGD